MNEEAGFNVSTNLEFEDFVWRVELTPTDQHIRDLSSSLPLIVLVTGFLLIMLTLTLQVLRHREQQKTRLLQKEITKRKQHEETVKRYMAELERSNKELDDFAYVASHDLKAPLRGIVNLSEWIEEELGNQEDSAVSKYLHLMKGRVARMEKLLNDLLTYSRVGRKSGEIIEVDVKRSLQDIFSMIEPPEKCTLKLADNLPTFETLATPLEQVFRNLISNAVKHSGKDDGIISVNARMAADRYIFSVADNGSGIPPEHQDKIFGIFQTLKPRDEVEGSGMGLAIVKKTLDQYGCTIQVISDGVNGTEFVFEWPIEIKQGRQSDD